MSYTKTDWENLPSTTTPVNATNMNKIEDELYSLDTNKLDTSANALIHRGNVANNTNLDNVTVTGMYYIPNVTVTNAPAGVNYKYTDLFVVNTTGGTIQQYLVSPTGNSIIVREYAGYPASWGSWRVVDFGEYSGTERRVGTWIDGKPIYKKTITVTNTALAAGSNTIAHGISNFKNYIKVEASKEGSQVLPYINLNASNALNSGTFVTNVDNTNITVRIFNDSWGSTNTWYFTLFYTKTTD